MVKKMIWKAAALLARFTPKRRYCFIKAMPSFEDSVVAVYEQLPMEQFDKVIWSLYSADHIPPFEDRGKTIYVIKGSLKSFYYGIISKYVFCTHGHFIQEVPLNQVCVNIWHGMPLKGIGLLDGQAGRHDTYLCSTSDLFQDLMASAMGMPLSKTLITGLPRNDLLHSHDPGAIWQKAGIDRSKYDKVFFWLPTYRKSVLGYLTNDGVEVDNVFNMKNFPTSEFNEFLKSNRCLCILKPHPMAPKKDTISHDHILIIDEDWLWKRKLTLYPLVGQVDFLVSDISSIMIDFMLLDRPMIACFEDAKEYQKSRSVVFDPIENYLPGVITSDYEGLISAIGDCVEGKDTSQKKRHALKKKFHKHSDFKSTKRLLDAVIR